MCEVVSILPVADSSGESLRNENANSYSSLKLFKLIANQSQAKGYQNKLATSQSKADSSRVTLTST